MLIEWLDGSTLVRGTVKKEDKAKLQVISLTGRTLSIKAGRFQLRHETATTADDFFAAIDSEAADVDGELLHGALDPGGTYSLHELAAAWFSKEEITNRDLSVLLAACVDAAPWFKVDRSGKISAAGLEEIKRWQQETAAKERREAECAALGELFQSIPANGRSAPSEGEDLRTRALDFLLIHLMEHKPLADWPALADAVDRAAGKLGVDQGRFVRDLLAAAGCLPPAYTVHMERFHRSFHRQSPLPDRFTPGRNIYPEAPSEELAQIAARVTDQVARLPEPLNAKVFSVDDATTEEIDDALSVETVDEEHFRVGVHIAAPGLFIPEESRIHAAACARATTVYQPDLKWTMLPAELIELFSLKAGRAVPAVATYYTFAKENFEIVKTEIRFEALTVAANLSYSAIESALEGGFIPELELLDSEPDRVMAWLEKDPRDFPWAKVGALPAPADEAIDLLVPLARHLFLARRAEGSPLYNRREFKIKVDADGAVDITERRRNSLAEGIVSELMILTNNRNAALLAEAGIPAIYRTQRVVGGIGGGTRTVAGLSINPNEHAGLGASFYCWSTSPLRRYADLINQRQLGALAGGELPVFNDESELLVRAKKMEFQSKAANSHQRRLERYWSMKYMESRPDEDWPVYVGFRENRARVDFDTLPFSQTFPAGEGPYTGGAALFHLESFDYYDLKVGGSPK